MENRIMEKDTTIYKESVDKVWKQYANNFSYHDFLKTLVGKRRLLIWGASYKSDWVLKLCERSGIRISGYIDQNPELFTYKGFTIYRPDILSHDNFFAFVALENQYPEVLWQLTKYKMQEFRDYIYPSINKVELTGSRGRDFDLNGNEVRGVIDGYYVELSRGSKLIIGENCKIDKSVLIRLGQNAILVFEDNCVVDRECIFELSDAICQIGETSHIGRGSVIHLENSSALVGAGFSCGPAFQLGAGQYAVCKVGKDCMFSTDVRIQCSDSHNYYDLIKSENIGMKKQYIVNLEEHVWVGAKSNLLYGTDIGAGSVVGMGSLVKGRFPANTMRPVMEAGLSKRGQHCILEIIIVNMISQAAVIG